MKTKIRINPNPIALRVGDKVNTDYNWIYQEDVFEIADIYEMRGCQSGIMVVAERTTDGRLLPPLDAAWFVPVDEDSK